MTNPMTAAMDDLTNEAVAQAEAEGKKPARKKTATKPKATTKAKPKAEEKPAPEPKPEPVTLEGFELAEGVNPEDVKARTAEAADMVGNIQNKDKTLLGDYLKFGGWLTDIGSLFKSTKLAGEYRKKVLPESEALDPALRSNCVWLYGAVNLTDHDAYDDLMKHLGLNEGANDRAAEIGNFKSANPTVIKREYRNAKKEAEAALERAALAEEMEMSEEEAIAAKAEADKAKAEEEAKETHAALVDMLLQHKKRNEIAEEAADIIMAVAVLGKAAALERLQVLISGK